LSRFSCLRYMQIDNGARSRAQGVTFERRVPGLTKASLQRFVTRASRSAGLKARPNILVTGSAKLRKLNRRFRGKDKVTDVLSFPPMPQLAEQIAGDIAISGEIAASNARRLGHSTADEVRVLALHGVLHLAGYDHEQDNGDMEKRELELRKAFRLPVGLIERHGKRPKKTGPTPRDVGLRRKRK